MESAVDTPEEAEEKVRAKAARIAESKRKAEELRLKRAADEKERWWGGAEFCGDRKVKVGTLEITTNARSSRKTTKGSQPR